MIFEPRTLRSWTWNIVAAVLLIGVAAACGLSGWAGLGPGLPAVLILAVPVLALVVGAIRVLFVGVIATPDALIVRELFRTYTLPWPWLRHVEVHRSKGVRPELGPATARVLHNPVIHYTRADVKVHRTVTVTALGAYRREVAQRRADEINGLIRRYSGRQS